MLGPRGRALLAGLLLGLAIPAPARAQELVLSVAVSMKEAVTALGAAFTAAHPGVKLRYNLGASGELQKQIEAGAPVDVFISAAERQMDELEAKGLVLPGSRRAVARNVLTVVKPADSRADLRTPADLLAARIGRVVIGNPRTVPVGQYAGECHRRLGLWERLQPKLVLAENVRQALDYVARGEVDAGFVYATDATAAAGRVVEAFRPDEASYRPIVYPAAVVAATTQPRLARAFIDLLGSPEGRRRWPGSASSRRRAARDPARATIRPARGGILDDMRARGGAAPGGGQR
jgi:molybdate transport system substrate-binding protein